MEKILIHPHNPDWKRQFEAEAHMLKKIMGDVCVETFTMLAPLMYQTLFRNQLLTSSWKSLISFLTTSYLLIWDT